MPTTTKNRTRKTNSTSKLAPHTASLSKTAKASASPTVRHEEIAQKAYLIWKSRGCPDGQAQQHWLEAEAFLKKS